MRHPSIALIFHLMPVLVLADQPYLRAFTLDQRQALALVLLVSYGNSDNYLVETACLDLRLKTVLSPADTKSEGIRTFMPHYR
jgi:hypothetical protein